MQEVNITADQIEARNKCLMDLLRLEVEYAVHLFCEGEYKSLSDSINQLTECYCYSDYEQAGKNAFEVPQWLDVSQELENVFVNKGLQGLLDSFWEIYSPHCQKKTLEYLTVEARGLLKTYYGFSYEYSPIYTKQNGDVITLHFRNYFVPESPFDHISELARGIMTIIDKSAAERPDVKKLQCGSWLNGLKPFRDLFGPSWTHKKDIVIPVDGTLGFWGQFIDRAGQLHQKNAARFRQSWELPKKNEVWFAEIDEIRAHILSILK